MDISRVCAFLVKWQHIQKDVNYSRGGSRRNIYPDESPFEDVMERYFPFFTTESNRKSRDRDGCRFRRICLYVRRRFLLYSVRSGGSSTKSQGRSGGANSLLPHLDLQAKCSAAQARPWSTLARHRERTLPSRASPVGRARLADGAKNSAQTE